MNRLSCLLRKMLLCMLAVGAIWIGFGLHGASAADGDFSGTGTQKDPYLITSFDDLMLLHDHVDSGTAYEGVYFAQTADITFPAGFNWDPIGNLDLGYAFAGIYDGQGHVLYDVYSNHSLASLFSWLTGEVYNLGIESGEFRGQCIGSIASHGASSAKIINCYNKASVIASSRGGGITDNFGGQILFCWNFGEITAAHDGAITAGIASYGNTKIQYSYTLYGAPVRLDSFSGSLTSSEQISVDQIAATLESTQRQMLEWTGDRKFTLENTIFLTPTEDSAVFAPGHIPAAYQEAIAAEEARLAKMWETLENRYSFKGEGTKKDPFLIETYEDLAHMRDCVDLGVAYEGYYFSQTADISFPDEENWDPIGMAENNLYFSGIYDGQGHVIENIYCNNSHASLFAWLNGEVRNLGIESGKFEGKYIGSIASYGTSTARIINCYNKAAVMASSRGGGLTDNFGGEILFCWNFGDITGTHDGAVTTGIVSHGNATIQYCYSVGSNLVHDNSFSGKIISSEQIESDRLEEMLAVNHQHLIDWMGQKEEWIDNLISLTISDEEIGFSDSSTLNGYLGIFTRRYYVELFLIAAAMTIGVWFLCTKRSKNEAHIALGKQKPVRKEEKPSPAEEVHSDENRASNRHAVIKSMAVVVLTAAMIIGGYAGINAVLAKKDDAGVRNLYAFEHEETPPDVYFVGASTLSVNIDVSELWNDYGIAGTCLGAGGSAMWDSYYRLVETTKDHTPELVVLDIYPVTHQEEYRGAETQMQNIAGYGLSMNKLKHINAAVEPDQRMEYILNLPLYHTRYDELKKWDFRNHNIWGSDYKGHWVIFYGNLYTPTLVDASQVTGYRAIRDKQEFYLRKSIEYCQENEIELLLIKTPDGDREKYQPYYHSVAKIAEEYGVDFLDMNHYDSEIGLLPKDFYYDATHLNLGGARKSSAFLGEYLVEHYELPDRRGDVNYDSWKRFASKWQNIYMTYVGSNEEYFTELQKSCNSLTVIPYRLTESEMEGYEKILSRLEKIGYEEWQSDASYQGETERLSLGNRCLTIDMDFSRCMITLDDESVVQLNSPGIILVAYDDDLDIITDIVAFTQVGNYKLQRLLWPFR